MPSLQLPSITREQTSVMIASLSATPCKSEVVCMQPIKSVKQTKFFLPELVVACSLQYHIGTFGDSTGGMLCFACLGSLKEDMDPSMEMSLLCYC